MNDLADTSIFLDLAWQQIWDGLRDRHSAARHPTFATVSPTGRPEARTVVLRAADRAAGIVEVHTDLASGKCQGLSHTPFAQLHIWEPKRRLQIRLGVKVDVLTGQSVAARWQEVPEASRNGYRMMPPPGQPIVLPFDARPQPQLCRFAVLMCRIERIDLLELGDRHRRAIFAAETGWAGAWVTP